MTPLEFLQTHSVFRREEFVAACYGSASSGGPAAARALQHHLRTGRLIRIRRGLYAVARQVRSGPALLPSSFQIAAKAAPDAILAYRTALEYLGLGYSLTGGHTFLTATKANAFQFNGVRYRPQCFPVALDTEEKRLTGVESRDDGLLAVRVTGLERTMVDLLDRPDLAGGWEEFWRSLAGAGYVDTSVILRHVRNLRNSTTAARVGWFLEAQQGEWLIPDQVLTDLEHLAPAVPVYLERSRREPGKLLRRWNLIVPERVLRREWEEVA